MANVIQTSPDHPSEPARCRNFGLTDVMILLAGMALCLSEGSHLLRFCVESLGRLVDEVAANGSDMLVNWPQFSKAIHNPVRYFFWYGFQFTMSVLFGLVPAFFVLRLRSPRPPLLALIRQPGTMAGLALVFGVFWVTGSLYYFLRIGRPDHGRTDRGRRYRGRGLDHPGPEPAVGSRAGLGQPHGMPPRSYCDRQRVARPRHLSDLKMIPIGLSCGTLSALFRPRRPSRTTRGGINGDEEHSLLFRLGLLHARRRRGCCGASSRAPRHRRRWAGWRPPRASHRVACSP